MDVVDRSSTVLPGAVEQKVEPGEILLREGDTDESIFEVVDGTFEILRGDDLERIATVGRGETLGEIAALAQCPRTATVRAISPSIVRRVDRQTYGEWLEAHPDRLTQVTELVRSRIDRQRAIALTIELLAVDGSVAAEVVELADWLHLEPGEALFAEDDESDAGYLVVSGRLTVSRHGHHVGEVGRGEIVGEIGLIERTARSATVVALRETTLARFGVDAFRSLAAEHPALMLQLSRTILARIGRPANLTDRARSIAVAITAPLDTRWTTTVLAQELARHGTTRHLWAARIDAALGRPGLVESGHASTVPALSEFIQDAETGHDYLLLETDGDDSRWTRRALCLADRIVVVMSANPHDDELRRVGAILAAAPPNIRVERWLAVVHPTEAERPSGSAALADRFDFDRVANLRSGSLADLRRLARVVSGNGTGLVLGGGGARGFAHLGVWRALMELGVDVDAIGGASIGAPLGAGMALQIATGDLVPMAAELFHDLLDYTVPVVSLIKGERITASITKMFAVDLRELWLPYFCVSTNLTRSEVEVHDRLDAATAIRASVAIPGVLPPVPFNGDLLVDGGVLNNLPCDVMRASGMVRRMIAVDLSPPVGPSAKDDFGLSVSGWKALRAQFGSGQVRYPGLVAILMRAMVAGSVRDRDRMLVESTVDCYLNLDLRGVQLLDFGRVKEVADRGYETARPRLEAWLAGQDS